MIYPNVEYNRAHAAPIRYHCRDASRLIADDGGLNFPSLHFVANSGMTDEGFKLYSTARF